MIFVTKCVYYVTATDEEFWYKMMGFVKRIELKKIKKIMWQDEVLRRAQENNQSIIRTNFPAQAVENRKLTDL
jgi:hypothetical protein